MPEIRVCYEDTDAGGVVYYGKYLRYLEQGRMEFFRERGLSVMALHEKGFLIPVTRLEIDYLAPAVLDDLIRVETIVEEIAGATFRLRQQVVRVSDSELLVDANLDMAFIGAGRKPRRLPPELLTALENGAAEMHA